MDDGSCPTFETSSSCLARTSMFDTTQSYCSWVEEGESAGVEETGCVYVQPQFTYTVRCVAIYECLT